MFGMDIDVISLLSKGLDKIGFEVLFVVVEWPQRGENNWPLNTISTSTTLAGAKRVLDVSNGEDRGVLLIFRRKK